MRIPAKVYYRRKTALRTGHDLRVQIFPLVYVSQVRFRAQGRCPRRSISLPRIMQRFRITRRTRCLFLIKTVDVGCKPSRSNRFPSPLPSQSPDASAPAASFLSRDVVTPLSRGFASLNMSLFHESQIQSFSIHDEMKNDRKFRDLTMYTDFKKISRASRGI